MTLATSNGYEPVCLVVQMDLREMGLTGEAIVTNIQAAPAVRRGYGRVVTATFKHSSGDCINLALSSDGTTETIGTTSNHPFWSVDRQDYVQGGSLQLDERVQTYSGDTKRVISKLPRPGPEAVYNLEVHGQHVYYVGVNGVLVHNTGKNVYVGGADGVGAPKSLLDDIVDEANRVASPGGEITNAQRTVLRKNLPVEQRRNAFQNRVRRDEFDRDQARHISDWERMTGQTWPEGATPHHIIPLESGGVNAWWNLMPTNGVLPNHSLPGIPGPHAKGGGIARLDATRPSCTTTWPNH